MKNLAITLVLFLACGALVAGEQHGSHHGKGKGCDMKAAEGKSVELTGTILCQSCDLKKSDTCAKVFQAADSDKTIYSICHGSKVDVEALGEEKATLKIKGKIVKCAEEEGKEELMISEAVKI
jgi:hypothetical protein